ncbi:MAG: pyruvate:ferredoxin (flavodoxin) oxidoreductase [Kiritimatiellia bacterium]
MAGKMIVVDANEAVGIVAHATNEVCAIYPITPSSPMGEKADDLTAANKKNLWGTIPVVVELQSEGGAAGALHGALTSGALTTTFTASQGLLLMIPNMYKIAGELSPTVFHVTARALAAQGLSIFGDHSDVMSVRQTGFAMLASNSVQEAMDFALIAQAATLRSRIPFVHFFDGFRTSHEVQKIEAVSEEMMRAMIDDKLVDEHRRRGLTPDNPRLRGTAQNPDVYFQGRETVNSFYAKTPAIVQAEMDKFATLSGRAYKLFDYVGAKDAERVIVIMGSGAETAHETVETLVAKGEKVGVVKIRLFRPFDIRGFIATLPSTVKSIAVLDRTKEPGSIGEPLYQDIRTAIGEAQSEGWCPFKGYPVVVGGRYGLGSKEFTPAMVKAVFDNLSAVRKNHFTIGINDDVGQTSLSFDPNFHLDHKGRVECMFFGLGSDGTVGANKNSIKIIGDDTPNYAQGYFVYDSKKAGSITVSHLRFGPGLIRSPYLCTKADFVACHNFSFLEKYDMLANAKEGAVFLLSSPYPADQVWHHIPDEVAQQIIDKKIRFFVLDANALAHKLGLGARINTIMQTAFFKISGVLPPDVAIDGLKKAIKKSYGKKGEDVVKKNWEAVDSAVAAIEPVTIPAAPAGIKKMPAPVPSDAPAFVKTVTGKIMSQHGDEIPVSQMPDDGTWPTATTQYEKRNIAVEIPYWKPDLCIQCGRCSFVCPHATIRLKAYDPKCLANAPETFKSADAKGKEFAGMKFTVQVAPEDCTGCGACVHSCPAREKDPVTKQETGKRAINMGPQIEVREHEAENFKFFLDLPEVAEEKINRSSLKGSQLLRPLFEFSGACAGCGETPYVKLLTQLVGDRLMIANATGCSSIYGGNLPTTPYCTRADGRGPSWSNSLFEDNAEFGFGMRLAVDKFNEEARELATRIGASDKCKDPLKKLLADCMTADQSNQAGIEAQRSRVASVKTLLAGCECGDCQRLGQLADYMVRKSVWVVGGDGWAYDIGYGGLDHVLASGKNVKILVLDTEVYSNTGGQASKSTPMGAVARFAAGGKTMNKKDLAMISMTYGHIYVATVAYGADPNQAVKAFAEAEAYDGPSLIIAYSHCINHGINMVTGVNNQKDAVASGHFPLFRYNPSLKDQGKNPLILDSKAPTMKFSESAMKENRFRVLQQMNPETAANLMGQADKLFAAKYDLLTKLAALTPCDTENKAPAAPKA